MTTSRTKAQRRKPPRGSRTRSAAAGKPPASAKARHSPQIKKVSSPKIITVVAETDHWAVLDKPALLDSQNSQPGRPSVVDWITERFGFSGLVHRLDFGTSGLMVVAKNAEAAKMLTNLLLEGRIKRRYLAVVLGQVLPTTGKEGIFETDVDGKSALTRFKVLEKFANATLVEVELETGRKHQIRVHFADAGHPLLGDHLYGKRGADRLFERPALHAFRLSIDGQNFEAAQPYDFKNLLAELRARRS